MFRNVPNVPGRRACTVHDSCTNVRKTLVPFRSLTRTPRRFRNTRARGGIRPQRSSYPPIRCWPETIDERDTLRVEWSRPPIRRHFRSVCRHGRGLRVRFCLSLQFSFRVPFDFRPKFFACPSRNDSDTRVFHFVRNSKQRINVGSDPRISATGWRPISSLGDHIVVRDVATISKTKRECRILRATTFSRRISRITRGPPTVTAPRDSRVNYNDSGIYIRPIERFIERNRLTISAREKRTLVKYIFVGVVRGTTEWEIGVGRIVVVVVNEKIVRVINIASRKTTIIIFVFEKRLAATYVQRI